MTMIRHLGPFPARAFAGAADRFDVVTVGRGAALEHGGARDEGVRAGRRHERRRLGRDAPVDLDVDVTPADRLWLGEEWRVKIW